MAEASAQAGPDWGEAVEFEDVSGQVAIAGVGEADHSKASGRSVQAIGAQAVERALEDAGLEPEQVDGIMYSGGIGPQFDEAAYREHFGTSRELWVSQPRPTAPLGLCSAARPL